MADYDYKAGKKRIKEILDNTLEVIGKDRIPKDDKFTFSNAYYGWVTGVFIDIRNSTDLFSQKNKEEVSKIIRSFTSEIIEILRDSDNLREIGIRGDCVYAIYATGLKSNVYESVDKTIYVNTFLKMLNKLLTEKHFPNISVGIGISTARELVVKAGRKDIGINNSVWIGDAVTKAANLSSIGNKDSYLSMNMSDITYKNIITILKENNKEENVENWFTKYTTKEHGTFYSANITKVKFDKWITDGMSED